jgi:hypothetical protein
MTWRLWRALRAPEDDDPLFQRVRAQPLTIPGQKLLRPLMPIYQATAVITSVVIIVIAPLALFFGANLFGAVLAFNIMNTINREREYGTYDLLALTPKGRGQINWLIAAACAYRLNLIDRLAELRILALITLVLLLLYSFQSEVLTPIAALGLLIALNLDGIQTLIIGCLSGMVAQRFEGQASKGSIAPFAALAIFVFLQIMVVFLPITVLFILLLQMARWEFDVIVVGSVLAALFIIREITLRLIWRDLERWLL